MGEEEGDKNSLVLQFFEDISISPKEPLKARVTPFTKGNVDLFLKNLKIVYKESPRFGNGATALNLDETSVSSVQKTQKIIGKKRVKQVCKATGGKEV